MVGKRFVFDFRLQLFIGFLLWNFIKCEILCNRPQSLANGYIPELENLDLNATFPINFVLTYDCNAGYRLQGGEPWRVCGKDGWSGTDPYCEGKVNIGHSSYDQAEILKKMNVEIFWIGFTGDQNGNTMNEIVSSSQYGNKERLNIFILKNYGNLHWMIQDIVNGTIDYSQCGLGMESKINNNTAENIGVKDSLQSWPWLAALFYKDPTGQTAELELKCEGSIINENFILTAAQCLIYLDLDTMEDRFRREEEIIVKLVPPEDNNPLYKPGEYGWIAYWAYPNIDQRNVSFVKRQQVYEFKLPILSTEKCPSPSRGNEQIFCAGGETVNAPCVRNAGGPFMQPLTNSKGDIYWTQVGINSWSWSMRCGVRGRDLYEFFTHVQRFRTWIDEKIKENVPDWTKEQCK